MIKLTILIILGLLFIFLAIFGWAIPVVKNAGQPPCEELIWMRDAPQARCVEYWKKRNLEEGR